MTSNITSLEKSLFVIFYLSFVKASDAQPSKVYDWGYSFDIHKLFIVIPFIKKLLNLSVITIYIIILLSYKASYAGAV